MVWRTSTLFASIACPDGQTCNAITCMFSHSQPADVSPSVQQTTSTTVTPKVKEPAPSIQPPEKSASKKAPALNREVTLVTPKTLTKSVTPPSLGAKVLQPRSAPIVKKSLTLNPRMVARAPMSHEKRTTFLKALHTELAKRNDGERQSENAKKSAMKGVIGVTGVLTIQETIEAALIIEEQMASSEGANYAGAMRSQVRAYKNMIGEAWIKHITSLFPQKAPETQPSHDVSVRGSSFESSLSRGVELQVLDQLIVKDLPALSDFGYVTELPSEGDIKESAAGVAVSKNFERCDRCGSNFQVFPQRNEDGRLTTNGPCRYHPEKLEYPTRVNKSNKHLVGSGTLDPFFSCCYEGRGTRGCTEHEHHVFKVTSPARLATTLPFITTPDNESPSKTGKGVAVNAVAFDCEMGYTTFGFELLRLTAVTWPDGEPLIDTLVRPMGILLDFNTRYSGVSQKDFDAARPFDGTMSALDGSQANTEGPLPIARNPAHARDILCSYITPSTPLIGHGIENDLRVVRLCHRTIVDTVLLYPHPKKLPYRHRLQHLTQTYLKRDIQTGGPQGHDSLEDSIATGDLVRAKAQEKMASLRRLGWTMVNDKLEPPNSGKRAAQTGPETKALKKQKHEHDGPTMAEYLAMSKADTSVP